MIDIGEFKTKAEILGELPPYTVTFDNITYTQIFDGEHWLESYLTNTPGDENHYTVHEILKRHFPNNYNIAGKTTICPPVVNELSMSLRLRIVRTVELKKDPPPPLPDEKLIDFLKHYDTYQTSQQFTYREFMACLFATDGNEELAAALYLYHGAVARRVHIAQYHCSAPSLVKIDKDDTGIRLTFDPHFNLNEFVRTACLEAITQANVADYRFEEGKKTPSLYTQLLGMSMRHFYYRRGYHLSITKRIRLDITFLLLNYIVTIFKTPPELRNDLPEPEYFTTVTNLDLSKLGLDEDFSIKYDWDDFIVQDRWFDKSNSGAMLKYWYDKTFETLKAKYAEHPEWNSYTPYNRKQLDVWISTHTRIAALDERKKFIVREPRVGYFFKFIDLIHQQEEEENRKNDGAADDIDADADSELDY